MKIVFFTRFGWSPDVTARQSYRDLMLLLEATEAGG